MSNYLALIILEQNNDKMGNEASEFWIKHVKNFLSAFCIYLWQ